MKQKLRSVDDLRTRYNPLCRTKAFKTEEETSSEGVYRSGDDIINVSRSAAISKVRGTAGRPYTSTRIRKSRRRPCESVPTAPGSPDDLEAVTIPGHASGLSASTVPGAPGNFEAELKPPSVWDTFSEEEPDPDVYDENQGVFDSDEKSDSVLDPSLSTPDYGPIFTGVYADAPSISEHRTYSGPYPLGGISLDQWYHVTFTRQSSGSSSIYRQYVDGALTSQIIDIAPMSSPSSLNPFRAGGLGRNGGVDVNRVLNGKMDQIATWDRALTPSQITELYNGGNGVEYSAMSPDLSNGIHQCFEFPEAVGVNEPNRVSGPPYYIWSSKHDLLLSSGGGTYAGERVHGAVTQVELGGHYDYSNYSLSQPGGKVSAHAFTPQWIDGTGETHGTNPDTGNPWTYAELNAKYSSSDSHKALLVMDETVGAPNDPSDEYTVSAWFSKHGLSGGTTTMDAITTSTSGLPLSSSAGACVVLSGFMDIGWRSLATWVWSVDYERDPSFWAWNL